MKLKWLWELSVEVPAPLEEPAAALIERAMGQFPSIYAPAESGKCRLTAYAARQLRTGGPELTMIRNGLAKLRDLGIVLADRGGTRVSTRRIRHGDWHQNWKKFFKPIRIGTTLLIKPSWSNRRAAPGQASVILDPGLSFGTGQHPTTQFCLRQIARWRPRAGGKSFLDVGTGAGILAIAAAKLGYRPVRGFDIDPAAVRIARANLRRNRLAGRAAIARADLRRLPRQLRRRFDLICANLLADILIEERRRWPYWLRPGGKLVLAGILAREFGDVQTAYQQAGFKLLSSSRKQEWQSGAFEFRG